VVTSKIDPKNGFPPSTLIAMSFSALPRVSGCPPTHFPREVLPVPPICPRTSPGSWGLNTQAPEGTPIPLFDIAGRMREKLPLSS